MARAVGPVSGLGKMKGAEKAKRHPLEPLALPCSLAHKPLATPSLDQSRRFLKEAAPAWRRMHWGAKVSCLNECFKHSTF